jgi:hypothetical protein
MICDLNDCLLRVTSTTLSGAAAGGAVLRNRRSHGPMKEYSTSVDLNKPNKRWQAPTPTHQCGHQRPPAATNVQSTSWAASIETRRNVIQAPSLEVNSRSGTRSQATSIGPKLLLGT